MARIWYSYDTIGNPYAISSYRQTTTTPGCLNGPVICAIYATNGGDHPLSISNNLREYIANGLSNNVAEPALPAGSKFFVYLKGLNL